VSVDVSTEVDVTALVGEMPDQPCESANHGHPDPVLGVNHDDGPATHYLQMMHECSWIGAGEIYAGCTKTAGKASYRMTRKVNCMDCGTRDIPPGEWIRVVGPIKS
jgi:hypothetical protein